MTEWPSHLVRNPAGPDRRIMRQLPDARLIRTRTFAELWVQPARLTTEISEFLDRVWADDEPPDRAEVS